MHKALIAIIFFSVGAGAGALVTRTIMNKKFVSERMKEMDAYEKAQSRPEIKKEGPTAEIEKQKEDILSPKAETPVEVTSFSSHKINTDKTDYTKVTEEKKKDEEADHGRYPWGEDEKKPKKKSIFDREVRPKPYVILKKQFGEENLHYHKVTLMAIPNGNGYDLVDEDEEPYDDEMVGPENLEQFGISDVGDSDVLYVRNEVESTDFEIIRIDR